MAEVTNQSTLCQQNWTDAGDVCLSNTTTYFLRGSNTENSLTEASGGEKKDICTFEKVNISEADDCKSEIYAVAECGPEITSTSTSTPTSTPTSTAPTPIPATPTTESVSSSTQPESTTGPTEDRNDTAGDTDVSDTSKSNSLSLGATVNVGNNEDVDDGANVDAQNSEGDANANATATTATTGPADASGGAGVDASGFSGTHAAIIGAGAVFIVMLIAVAIIIKKRRAASKEATAAGQQGDGIALREFAVSHSHKNLTKAKASVELQSPYGFVDALPRAHSSTAQTVNNPGFVGIVLTDDGGGTDGTLSSADGKSRLREPESASTEKFKGKFRVPATFVPANDCRMALLRSGDILGVSRLHDIVEDVSCRLEQDGIAPTHQEYNHRFAFYMYTFNAQFLSPEQQFFAVLNQGLRRRQEEWFDQWMPFMYYLINALRTLPDVETTVYKGMAMPANVSKYNNKKKIHWCGFSSTTTDESVAQSFAGVGGLMLKIEVHNGKNVQPYSWFGKSEAELILTPNMEFIVTSKKPYTNAGITYIDLQQLPSETLYS